MFLEQKFIVGREARTVELLDLGDYTYQTGIGRYVRSLKQHLEPFIEVKSKKACLLPLSKHLSFLQKLPVGIEGHEPGDLVHIPQIMGCSMLLWNDYMPSVATVHDLGFLELPAEWKMLDPIARQILRLNLHGLKKADLIVAVSEFTRKSVIKHLRVPDERVVTVHSGIDHGKFRPIPNARSQLIAKYADLVYRPGKWLLYVGSDFPRKNLCTLLEALAIVKQTNGEFCLLKVGSPGLEEFGEQTEAVVKRLGLEGNVLFMGRVPDEDLPLFYAACDLFVHPSKLEGFGFPVLEAMACGTPVVCSNSTSLPEMAGDAALFFEPSRPDEMAIAITRALEDQALRVARRAKGIAQAGTFTWQETASRMVEVYQDVFDHVGAMQPRLPRHT